MTGRTSGASRFNIDKFSEVLGFRGMEKVVGKRDDFVMDALFNFQPVQRINYRGHMLRFGVPITARARKFYSNWRRDRRAARILEGRGPESGSQHQEGFRRCYPGKMLKSVHAIWCNILYLLQKNSLI